VIHRSADNAHRAAVRCPGLGLTERRPCRAEQVDLYALRPRWHGCLLARMRVSAFSSCGPNVVPGRAPGSVAGAYDLRRRGGKGGLRRHPQPGTPAFSSDGLLKRAA
jgi:hypothetical protein